MSDETQPAALPREETGQWQARQHRAGGGTCASAAMCWQSLIAWPIVMTVVYTVVPPPFSNVMLLRALSGNGINKDWVGLDEISPHLPRAVITSEDARFCEHRGVDWTEFQGVIEDALEAARHPCGASTISDADGQEPLPVGRALCHPQGAGTAGGAVDGPGLVEAADDRDLSQHRRMGAGGLWRGGRRPHHFKKSAKNLTRGRRRCWPPSCQTPSSAVPESPPRGSGPSPTGYRCGWREWVPISLALGAERRYKPPQLEWRGRSRATITWSCTMAVPRKKMSKSRIGMRRSGHQLGTVTWVEDKKSGELRPPAPHRPEVGPLQGPSGPDRQVRRIIGT